MKKQQKPRKAIFLAQPGGALVGPGKKFADHWELCRGLAGLGAEAVTIPACAPYIDLEKARMFTRHGKDYCRELKTRYEDCGTPLLRLEAHISGNLSLLHTSRLMRFKQFVPAELLGSISEDITNISLRRKYETVGEDLFLHTIMASANLESKDIVAFSGGRAWQAAQYPWPAWPQDFRAGTIALLIHKWAARLAFAAQHGIRVGFELHPEQDLCSPVLLKMLKDALEKVSPEAAVHAVAANADASHETLIGGNAADHMEYLARHNLLKMVHLKDAQTIAKYGASLYGDFSPRWSDSRRRFATFGTGDADWGKIIPLWLKIHEESAEGLDFVGELECSRFPSMWQGAQITLENMRRAIAREDMLNPNDIEVEPSDGDWESFCSTDLTALDLLEVDLPEERAEVTRILKKIQ